jgi:phenylalanyl-tRNA synthetase beta chain
MECGHPLHAFNLASVKNTHIIVRKAEGFARKFTTLDGKERELDPATLLIADAEKPLAIAGIMGGENSEINNATTDVLIESVRLRFADRQKSLDFPPMPRIASNAAPILRM